MGEVWASQNIASKLINPDRLTGPNRLIELLNSQAGRPQKSRLHRRLFLPGMPSVKAVPSARGMAGQLDLDLFVRLQPGVVLAQDLQHFGA